MKSFIITESEKNRILNMHKSATSKHYLMEQGCVNVPPTISKFVNFKVYDLENNQTIIPTSEEEINTPPQGEKVISRNVSSRRRNFR